MPTGTHPQSIFLAILQALSTYDPKKAVFRTWLYCIAANKIIDVRRQSRPVTTPLEESELPVQEDFVSRIYDRELLKRIEGYVSGLAPSLQTVFQLRLYEKQSFGEIAAALGQSEAAVKNQYYRLLGRIREEFDPDENLLDIARLRLCLTYSVRISVSLDVAA